MNLLRTGVAGEAGWILTDHQMKTHCMLLMFITASGATAVGDSAIASQEAEA